MSEPRIAFATPSTSQWSETFVTAHLKGLKHVVLVLTDGFLPSRTGAGRPILENTWDDRFRNRYGRWVRGMGDTAMLRDRISTLLKKSKAQVVFAEYGPTGSEILGSVKATGLPLVVHFHGNDAHRSKTLRRYKNYDELLAYGSAFIVVSRVMERQLHALGAPVDRVHYICSGIDVIKFAQGMPASNPPRLIFVGRFTDKKAPMLTLLAFHRAWLQYPEARLTIVGTGELWESVLQVSCALGMEKVVELPGVLPPEEVASAMRSARAYVQHSVTTIGNDMEGTPVAVLEAMASGLPIIATRHAGIADVVTHRENGLLCDEFDIARMAVNMLAVLNDAEGAGRMGAAGRAYVEDHLRVEDQVAALQLVLGQVVQQHRRA